MNDPIFQILREVQQKFRPTLVKTEYYSDARWVRFSLGDRHEFLNSFNTIADIIDNYGMSFDLDSGWDWERVEFNGLSFNNPRPTYKIFVSYGKKPGNRSRVNNISDSTDELYDINPIHLVSASKDAGILDPGFYCSTSYTWFGFKILASKKKDAIHITEKNPFNRLLETKYDPISKQYHINVYMNDKTPDTIETFNFKYQRPRKIKEQQ